MAPDQPPPYASAPTGPHPRLEPLGVAFILLGVVDVLWGIVMLLANALQLAGVIGAEHGESADYEAGRFAGIAIASFLSLLALPVGGVSIFAGIKMRRAELYSLALFATLVNMLPCYQTVCCALLGIPLGIWSLVTLMDAEVKGSFRA